MLKNADFYCKYYNITDQIQLPPPPTPHPHPSALLDQLVDRQEGLLEAESFQGAAGLNLPRLVCVAGKVQLSGDLML